MNLRVLGCDGSYPSANGACSSYLLDCGSAGQILLDCGSGALSKLMAVMDPAKLRAIVITHWHNDHASDLLTLRYYLQIHGKKLALYCPISNQALRTLCICDQFEHRDITQQITLDDVTITSSRVTHPVPAYAVKIAQGRKSLVYSGDAALWQELQAFCRGSNLLLCDATFLTAQWRPGLPHMSAHQAGKLANEAQVKQLLCTHCQPGTDEGQLLAEAKSAFSEATFAKAGATYQL